MKSINPEEFFKLIALKSGISDLETIRRVYYGMIKVISGELRSKHVIKMPDWGEFSLLIYKSRRTLNVNTRQLENLPPKPMVKFHSDVKVKKYFHALIDQGL